MRALKGWQLRPAAAAATGLAIALVLSAAVVTGPAGARERPCNGSVELCSRQFDRVVLPGTHNSMSAADLGWKLPNQLISIPRQLRAGIRGFLIDTHYGTADSSGVVTAVPKEKGHAAGDRMYLCHEVCQIGSSDLIEVLGQVSDFLDAHRREVIVIVNQDGVTPGDYRRAVVDSGLIDHVYRGPTTRWPTLRRMIATDQRAVMLSEGATGPVPWYHDAYAGVMQETPYDFRGDGGTTREGIDRLTDPAKLYESCRPNRGGTDGSLFLMNHWVNGLLDNSNPVEPDPAVARILNTEPVLVRRARACERRRGLMPTVIAVDDFGEGDLLGAVRKLNGVAAEPFLVLHRHPRRRSVRAGGRARFRLKVGNIGRRAGRVRICARVSKRLAVRPRCRSVSLAVGSRKSVAVRIRARSRAAGSGAVRFTARARGDRTSARARLTVVRGPETGRG